MVGLHAGSLSWAAHEASIYYGGRLARRNRPLCEGLEDTLSLAFTDLYLANLSFYASVKQAAKRGVAGADTIYNDLKVRFPGRSPAVAPVPPTA